MTTPTLPILCAACHRDITNSAGCIANSAHLHALGLIVDVRNTA